MAEAAYSKGIYVRSEQDHDPCAEDTFLQEILDVVFHHREEGASAAVYETSKPKDLMHLQHFLGYVLDAPKSDSKVRKGTKETTSGRIGPAEVVFDFRSNGGSGIVSVESHRLEVTSCSNFSTIRANCCVFKVKIHRRKHEDNIFIPTLQNGKWVYEVMLGSQGMMQIGWCTIGCKFFHEEGVGDTIDSYAFDGNRVRKWNKTTQRYGEAWTTGDIISCAIDCDEGTVTFYRNGKNMGKAFSNINLGPGYAYFPAVSLAASENLRANFGATPLRYPLEGYKPLQDPPVDEIGKAWYLLDYLENLLPYVKSSQASEDSLLKSDDLPLSRHPSKTCTTTLVAAHLFDQLAPLLKNPYIVEHCLIKFLLRINRGQTENEQLISMFDLLWSLMQDFEIKSCMECLAVSLLSLYRFSPATSDFKYHKDYLTLLLSILHHQHTRRYLLSNVLFDKIKFAMFMHIKSPDDKGLSEFIPEVWYEKESDIGKDDDMKKMRYMKSCDQMQKAVEEVESIQIDIIKALMIHVDVEEQRTTRMIFMEKCRKFLHDNSGLGRIQHASLCPSTVILCMFHRMVHAVRYSWDKFYKQNPLSSYTPSEDAYVPIQQFWSDMIDYFEFQRCGGLISHVNRMLGSEVNKAQGLDSAGQRSPSNLLSTSAFTPCSAGNGGYPAIVMPSGNSLMELLDDLVMMYHIAAHKQLGKVCNLRDSMKEFVESLQDTEAKLRRCPIYEETGVRNELTKAREVFTNKIEEQARQMAWVISVIYSKNKRADIEWLFLVVIKTLSHASFFKVLFQYVPEYYIMTAINGFNALFNFFHPTVPFKSLDRYNKVVYDYALFIIRHFSDHRILNPDLREDVIQAFACFICYPETLEVLEDIPEESTVQGMVKALITPNESRSLSQCNWILVRIWKGCGYRFRYTHLPHSVPSKIQPTQFGFAMLQKPLPSFRLQELIRKHLLLDTERASKFLDMILNQLNWSFSEFIGLMQEIQQKVTSPEIRILEGRQLKICATCFEIAVCLMRVLEMIVTITPVVFLDPSMPSSELLLKRLIQVMCQILNRITARSGIFEGVVSLFIQGLESVSYFPIATAMIGILIQLVVKSKEDRQQVVLRHLLSDPGFTVPSLEYLVGKLKTDTNIDKDILPEEKTQLEDLMRLLKRHEGTVFTQQTVKEDDLCTICYSDQMTAVFVPCGHKSCRNCISHQMMSKKECFFCKAEVTDVKDFKGASIIPKSPK